MDVDFGIIDVFTLHTWGSSAQTNGDVSAADAQGEFKESAEVVDPLLNPTEEIEEQQQQQEHNKQSGSSPTSSPSAAAPASTTPTTSTTFHGYEQTPFPFDPLLIGKLCLWYVWLYQST